MFHSNDKIHGKRDSSIHLDSGFVELAGSHSNSNRVYNEDFLVRPRVPTGHSSEPNINYDENHFDRRLPPQSSGNSEYQEDQDHRKVRFRNGGRKMYGKDAHNRSYGFRNGDMDEGSSVSSESGYVGLPGFVKMPQDYLRTPPDYLKTPPDFLKTASDKLKMPSDNLKTPSQFKTPPESKTPPELLPTPEFIKTSPEFSKNQSHGEHQSHGNQLLNLRAALNEKELQLVELREQHIIVLNRAAEARQNWEEALKSKDRVIMQLQRTLQYKKSQLDRQEWENQENLYTLRKRQEEYAEVEREELKVALLETKNAQFVQELVYQQKLITRMKRHIDEKEKLCVNQNQKMEMMNGRVQDLKAGLQDKEEEVEAQSKYCIELKNLLWKRDSVIAQLQISEQQVQSNLARKEAAREALAVSRDKVQEEKTLVEKRLSQMQNQYKALANGASRSAVQKGHHQSEMRKLMELKDDFSNVQEGALKDLDDREGVMHRIQKRMRELRRSLRSKDNALSDKNNEHQQALQEIQKLTQDFEALKLEFEDVSKRNYELESTVAHLQEYTYGRMGASVSEVMTPPVEVLPYEFSQGGSTGEDLGFDDGMQDSMDSELLSNASVYHANFEKIKIVEVEMSDIDSQQEQQKSLAPPTQPPVTPPSAVPSTSRRPPQAAEAPLPSGPLNNDTGGHSSELDANYNSIQDEIKKREQCWRKTEELMRLALTRRMRLLVGAKEVRTSEADVTWSAQTGLKMNDRSGHLHPYHLQEESTARGKTDRKARLEQENWIERRKQTDDENSLDYHIPHRKVLHQDGHKYHMQDGTRGQRENYEQDVYQLDDDDDVNNRRRHEQVMFPDRRKSADGRTQQEYCKYSQHYRHHGRSSRTHKGRFP